MYKLRVAKASIVKYPVVKNEYTKVNQILSLEIYNQNTISTDKIILLLLLNHSEARILLRFSPGLLDLIEIPFLEDSCPSLVHLLATMIYLKMRLIEVKGEFK